MTEQRIPVTITGSLLQRPEHVALLEAAARGEASQADADRATAQMVAAAVAWQRSHGIDLISDGEQGRLSFMGAARLGFNGPPVPVSFADIDQANAEPWALDYMIGKGQLILPSSTGPVAYDRQPITTRIEQFRAALGPAPAKGAFLASPSPGTVALAGSSYGPYSDHREFVAAIAAALRQEYQAIIAAGFDLQIDSPDLAIGQHAQYQDMPRQAFLDQARADVEALNEALDGIDRQRIRLHCCWGNYPGPHHCDIPLADIIDLLYQVNAGMLVLEGANPQHRSDWRVLASHRPPAGLKIAAGVIDAVTPHVESPQVVADMLVTMAQIVGPDRLLAVPDCGFSTFAGAPSIPAGTAWLKLAALVDGAALASALVPAPPWAA